MNEPSNFEVATKELADGCYIIALCCECDMSTAPRFKQALFDVIERGAYEVIVDLTGTNFIDSTNLGVLISGVKQPLNETVVSLSFRPTGTQPKCSRSRV